MDNILNVKKNIEDNRLKVCYACPIYSKRRGGICDGDLWFNPNTGDVSTKQRYGYINGCGCLIKSKVKLVTAQCPASKW